MAIGRKATNKESSIKALISTLEVDAVGIASLAEWKGTKLKETALRLLPEAKSVVVFAMEIYPEFIDFTSPVRVTGEASLGDLFKGNTEYLYGRLTKAAYDLAKVSRRLGLKALPMSAGGCPTDARFLEAVFSYKHAAQAAGLGKLGWQSLLITPDFGPRVFLSCCLTEANLEPTDVKTIAECDGCAICLDNCPAKALARPEGKEQYTINKFACSSFRNASGGCSECMRLCPIGR